MKLLLDQNFSVRNLHLVWRWFPDSSHVTFVGLSEAADESVWEFARANGFVLVSSSDDFRFRSLFFENPPKVICFRRLRGSTDKVCEALCERHVELEAFGSDPRALLMILP